MLTCVPKPLPDEFLFSWVCRIAEANAIPLQFFCEDCLGMKKKSQFGLNVDIREGFPELCMEINAEDQMKDIYLATSTFRLESIIMSTGQQTRYINSVFRKWDRLITSGYTPIKTVRVCPECLRADKEKYGVAYLHREHQLSGVCTCPEHHCRLLEYKGRVNCVFDSCPDDFQEVESDNPIQDDAAYAQYAVDILRSGLNMNMDITKAAITNKLKDLGYTSSDDYTSLKDDIQKWEHHALFDGIDIAHFLRRRLANKMSCQIREIVSFLMFLYPTVDDLAKQIGEGAPILVQCRCPICGRTYCATPQSQKDGWGCPYCEENIPEEERFEDLVQSIGKGEYELLDAFKSIGTRVHMRHKDCGEVFTVSPGKFLFGGARCPCTYTITEAVAKRKIEENEGFLLDTFNGAGTHVGIRHIKCGHVFFCDYHKFLQFPSCRYCNPPHMTAEIYADRVEALVGDEYTVTRGYVDHTIKVSLRHNECGHEQEYKPSAFLDGQRCKYCQKQIDSASLEEALEDYSDGRYQIKEYGKNVCVVLDEQTGDEIKIPPLKIRQEIERPTPSDVLPIDRDYKVFNVVSSWEKNYMLLRKYKKDHDTADVPKREEYQGVRLGLWVQRQRLAYRSGELSQEDIELLEDIGFVWDSLSDENGSAARQNKLWKERLDLLKQYRDEYGSTDVLKSTVYKGFKLGEWVWNRRSEHSRGRLSKDREQKLDEINFLWGSDDPAWVDMCRLLERYREDHGTVNVPFAEEYNGVALGVWLRQQKRAYNDGVLRQSKIRELEQLGVVWGKISHLFWDDYIFLLALYKKDCADLNITSNTRYMGEGLGFWCANQRRAYKQGALSKDKIDALNALGFVWEPDNRKKFRNEQWERNYEMLRQYIDENGNVVPPQKACYRGVRLGVWYERQRSNRKKGLLSQEQIDKLDAVGFHWKADKRDDWDRSYRLLKQYNEENGVVYIPKNVVFQGERLGLWCDRARKAYRDGTLSKTRTKALDKIGFIWQSPGHRSWLGPYEDNLWGEKYELLKEYKKQYGDTHAVSGKLFHKVDLGGWCSKQRQGYRNGTLKQDRIQKLEAIGFCWEVDRDPHWNECFEQVKKYKSEHGTLKIPRGTRYHDTDLAIWCTQQRRKYKDGKLSQEQINKLDSIGFVWDTRARKQEIWDRNYNLLIQYMAEHDGMEPSHDETYCGVTLGSWCVNQRSLKKTDELRKDREERLDAIGFHWQLKTGPKPQKH